MPIPFFDDFLDIVDTFVELFTDEADSAIADTATETAATPVDIGSTSEPQFAGVGCYCGLNPNICGSGPFCKYGA